MRISDWSSDVCFSDLVVDRDPNPGPGHDVACHQLGPELPLLDRLGGRGEERLAVKARATLALVGRLDDHRRAVGIRSEEHTSELQSLMRISYAVFCLKKTNYY